ncbi:hypothetical protein [Hydrogenovibrio sp. JE_KL2]|jgi:hypothetical protein|uniref:hypothetical protein n=1 Tax=Hydrogenovibrio sp. JE_KL2 TaxID=2651188 RepID=UPI00128CB23A|nr:hypothetical protein [Hydrogenovibrio sp. JE_KL2]MPQ77297.1 hypothetical protein [Hydrogenovibrio sp. JE_KL2]
MAKKRFDTDLDREWIDILAKMPLERRRMELKHCDLHSLAKAFADYPNWQAERIAEALQPPVSQEFIKAVKIYKGELPFPKKLRKRVPVLNKMRMAMSILAVVVLIALIFVLNVYFPSN